ncbi:MAG: mannose-1-phosphate guanyltransferase [Verrucomicrobia bacterium]|nr:MAG: mannose-1-phosphate guanyltransferase [Verrucomicrobiota bacterium]
MNPTFTVPNSVYVFIMAGGSGERFWPMSRRQLPKHLLRVFGERTLLEHTIRRVEGVVPLDRIFVLINQDQYENLRKELPFLAADQIITEPTQRDTAPAAALATAIARSKQPEAVVVLLPADAIIRDAETFRRQLIDAIAAAIRKSCLVTIAVTPTYPATGFGYLELGPQLSAGPGGSAIYRVLHFIEKPDQKTAQHYFQQSHFGWNAGIFVWQTKCFLEECSKLSPPLAHFIHGFPKDDPASYILEHFPNLSKNSVDYAIMEHASHVVALRSQFDWDDVGSWNALPTHLGRDRNENCVRGSAILIDSENNIVIANQRTVALCGVQDLVVVETPDAILVCHQNAVQDIKKVCTSLPDKLR